ncbi:hypothetical protein ACFSTE_00630 [Aquimarina hainanensis]|uniref:Uncharacterized protein n=1 Tax=Aquimarina hainanensis TaxID=1578017 RepID=A0ABW5N5B0_9FLAO|nr:hypothetical protein [Aquimarina sp. TRL1]QKX04568.1 hypothetical protein HN014_06455 [Aquimarina sp. TRL1]
MSRYYKKTRKFLNATAYLEALISLDYFASRDDLYQYGQTIIIEMENPDFDYWFALKLRQYDTDLKHLKVFLDYPFDIT